LFFLNDNGIKALTFRFEMYSIKAVSIIK